MMQETKSKNFNNWKFYWANISQKEWEEHPERK